MISSPSFTLQTDDEEDDGATDPTEETVSNECGFFCTIGEFIDGLFD